MIPSRVESNRIILSNIQMEQTIKNITINPNCFISVYIKEQYNKQIKIKGIGKIYNKGQLFEEIKYHEEANNLPPYLKVNSIIDVEITQG